MDPGMYGQGQGTGYHTGVPVYFNQQSSFVHSPVYHTYPHGVSQPQVIFTPHQAPVSEFYQRPPPMQPITAQAAGPPRGVPVYPHVPNVPPPVKGQPLRYTGQPLQQYTAPTHHSNLVHPSNPMGPPVRPVEKSSVPVMSTIPWSTAVSPPPTSGFSFTQRSTTPPSGFPPTAIPPRVNSPASLYKQIAISTSDASSSTFLNAASQHGIVIGRPETPPSTEPSKSVTPPTSQPFSFIQNVPSASRGFEIMNNDGNRAIDRQNLVNYYVNKHESLSHQNLPEHNLNNQNGAGLGENFNNNANEGLESVNKNLKEVHSKYNDLNNSNHTTRVDAKPLANGDRNSNVLNWLSKSEGEPISDDHYDYSEEVDEKGSGPDDYHVKNLEDPLLKDVNSLSQAVNAESKFKTKEDSSDVNDNYFDDSVDIVIEEHEFLSFNVSTSPFGDENSSSTYGDDDESYVDEVDGGVDTDTRLESVKTESELVCINTDELCRTKEHPNQINTDKQVVERELGGKQQSSEELLSCQTDDEKIVNQYQHHLEDVEKAQIEILASAGKEVEEIASNIVSQAVAKGVLRFFSAFKNKHTDIEKEGYENILDVTEVKSKCGKRSEEVLQSSAKGLYSWNVATVSDSEVASVSDNEMNKEFKGKTDDQIKETHDPSVQEITVKPSSKKSDDFEKFFFKRTASRHGITIESPEKAVSHRESDNIREDTPESTESQNDEDPYEHLFKSSGSSVAEQFNSRVPRETGSCCESQNIKQAFKMGIKRLLSEEVDSDVNSVEGSQSDVGDAFRIKASRSGILVQDPSERVEFSTDSDAELEQLSGRRNTKGEIAELERKRSTSTPDPFNLLLNPESPEFKPGWKKRTVSGGLRPDAVEFNPESLNSSFSLNTSITGSDISEKQDSSMRVDAPVFVPVSIKTGPKPRYDPALFESKEQKETIRKIFYLPTPKEITPNRPSVAVQASPNTSTICVGTRRIRTKESSTVTTTCNSRDVSVNTGTGAEIDSKNVTVKRSSIKFMSKATNTDMSQKRSIGINVRSKNAVKLPTKDVTTMTDTVQEVKEEWKDTGSDQTDLQEKLRKQAALLESMGGLQIELMLFKEKEIREKVLRMKEDLMKRMTSVMGLFTDGVEADMLQSMIQSKLQMLEEALTQVTTITYSTISQIKSGQVLDHLPDFGNILPQMSKSPTQKFTSPNRQSMSSERGMSPLLGSSPVNLLRSSPKLGTSLMNLQGNSPKSGTSLTYIPGTSPQSLNIPRIARGTSPVSNFGSKVNADRETSPKVTGLRTRLSNLTQDEQSTSRSIADMPEVVKASPSKLKLSSPAGKLNLSSSPVGKLKLSSSPAGKLNLSSSPAGKLNLSSSPAGKLNLSSSPAGKLKLSSSPAGKLSVTDVNGQIKFPNIDIGSLSVNVSSTDFNAQPEEHVNKLKPPSHVVSVTKSPVKSSDQLLTPQKSPTLTITKTSSPMKTEENVSGSTMADSVKELDNLKTESPVLARCPDKSQRKVPRTRGFMEIEDSSEDEEEDEESAALVVDQLYDEAEGKENKEKENSEKENEEAALTQTLQMVPDNETSVKEFKAESKCPRDEVEVKAGDEIQITEQNDTENKQVGSVDEETLINRSDECHEETNEKENDSFTKLDESGDVNYETADDERSDKDTEEVGGNEIHSKDGNMEKMISEKMFVEYGKKNEDSDMSANTDIDNSDLQEAENNVKTNFDAIDSDDNFHNDSYGNSNAGAVDQSVVPHEEKSDKEPENVKEGICDNKFELQRTVGSVASAIRPGMFGSEINIDPKEVFMSPPRKSVAEKLKQSTEVENEVKNNAVMEFQGSQSAFVGQPVGGMGMPVMMGNIDPVLYQAVLAQLLQAYPELASNQAMLTQVAVQQTSLLQMYMNNQSGGVNQAGGLINSAGVQGMIGNMGMMGHGQPLEKADMPAKSCTKQDSSTTSVASASESQTDINSTKKVTGSAPGFPIKQLDSECKSKSMLKENEQKLDQSQKVRRPPGFTSKDSPGNVEPASKKQKASDDSFASKLVEESDKKHVNDTQVVKNRSSLLGNEAKPEPSSTTGLDDFELPPSYGARPKSLNNNNNANCNNNAYDEQNQVQAVKKSNSQPDFLPDFAKRHKPENNSMRVVHHFVKNVSDSVSRAIANSDQVNFERKTPSPPVKPAQPARFKVQDTNFPPLQKSGRSWSEFATAAPAKGTVSQNQVATDYNRMTNSTKSQFSGPANLPPRLRRQSSSDGQPRQPSPVYYQEPQKYPSPKQESWDDEVDDHAQTFNLHHNVHKPITMATAKNQQADLTNPFLAPAPKEVPKVKLSNSVTGLCDIPLPKANKETEEKEEAVEEWQEVQTKRKRHSSKEHQKELRKFSAPYLNSAPVTNAKQQKATNFDRLVGRMQQEFPHASRQEVVDAIQKIRVSRGSLSGLSMEVILEKAQSFIKPGQKKIPGLWAEQKKPAQTLNLPPRMQQSVTKKPVSLLELKLPPRKPASVGLLKLDIPPRMQQYYVGSDTCTNTFEEDICVICHDPLTTEPVKELDCMHVFHSQCISQWVERERTCPTCRKLALFPEEFPRLGK